MGKKKTKAPESQEVVGYHNNQFIKNPSQAVQGYSYKDRSTVCFIPTPGMIHMKVALSHENLMRGMNQKFTKIPLIGMEVGAAYEQMVDILRSNDELKTWPYVLTLEHDNVPPPDGLLKLYEDIESGPWDAVGGLYWCKGPGGQPMSYGRPNDMPRNFIPWLPPPNSVSQVHGLGMGMTLFRTKMFLDPRFERPLFKTQQEYTPGVGVRAYTQDLRFFENAGKLGYRVACSTRVLVGHFQNPDAANPEGVMW